MTEHIPWGLLLRMQLTAAVVPAASAPCRPPLKRLCVQWQACCGVVCLLGARRDRPAWHHGSPLAYAWRPLAALAAAVWCASFFLLMGWASARVCFAALVRGWQVAGPHGQAAARHACAACMRGMHVRHACARDAPGSCAMQPGAAAAQSLCCGLVWRVAANRLFGSP